jgi:predicted  nucleic acid-binding Zn-ribbon protein
MIMEEFILKLGERKMQAAILSPAQQILLEAAQEKIDQLSAAFQAARSELRDYERTVTRLNAELKSLKLEMEQRK